MPYLEALKLALASILSHKLRSFLTLLGVIFGVATVIVVVSLIEGFNSYVDEKIANIGTNAFAVSKYAIDDFSGVEALNAARRRNKDVTLDDAAALQARAGSIQDVGAKEDAAGDVKFGASHLFRIHISATTPNIAEIERIEAGEGRYFTKAEEESRRNVTFIGADVAEKLFPRSNPLGQTIRIDGRAFEVVGVGKAKGSVFGQPQDMYVAMPLSTFLALYGSRRSLNLSVTSTNPETYLECRTTDRRYRRDEHHAGVRNGAHAGNRRQESNWRATARHRVSVSDRSGDANGPGRHPGNSGGLGHCAVNPDHYANLHSNLGADCRLCCFSGVGCDLRIVAGMEGGATESD
jgi:putative ABC transport system permease protein